LFTPPFFFECLIGEDTMRRDAFTMVELVFVIVILGILATIAVPRLAMNRDDANIVKFKTDISAIRSSIATTRAQNLLTGNNVFPDTEGNNTDALFEGVLNYPIQAVGTGKTGWRAGAGAGSYILRLENTDINFNYVNGVFGCGNNSGAAANLCNTLTQ